MLTLACAAISRSPVFFFGAVFFISGWIRTGLVGIGHHRRSVYMLRKFSDAANKRGIMCSFSTRERVKEVAEGRVISLKPKGIIDFRRTESTAIGRISWLF